ncbi:hypothetical protein XOC_0568 [Xanthomonas oryzae pv. oryzicola BLS256]|uniref:Uncharacterized protein n=1 Tax=Xanthomonas oryzae pv. oryzicola (strain BLS256) TaxID=383407 RepID=G7TAL1_XANOB|nr:hypothetical protein XOC_0568 [Xanthomonas oryzae pv. oryzicola BLS256]QEO99375.1 hypothetical protein XOCgx_4388 [Xanthomonas oryzae pv. oryzicola]
MYDWRGAGACAVAGDAMATRTARSWQVRTAFLARPTFGRLPASTVAVSALQCAPTASGLPIASTT